MAFLKVIATLGERQSLRTLLTPERKGEASGLLPPNRLKVVTTKMNEMLNTGVMHLSNSTMVISCSGEKEGQGSGFCFDYRRLNDVARTEAYSLPRINDKAKALNGAKYFSSIDLAS